MSEPVANPYAHPVQTAPPLSPADEKQWSILTHVLSIFFVISFGSIFITIAASAGSDGSGGAPASLGLFFVGYILVLLVRLIALVYGILASVKAGRGEFYRYPLAFGFFR